MLNNFYRHFKHLTSFILLLLMTNFITANESIDPYQYKIPRATINAEFNYQAHYQQVFGSNMFYLDEGTGDAIIFLHGNPTSSYLWRNILPYTKPYGRSIAIDLIGMGQSDKPDIAYTFADHYHYLEQFLNNLDLDKITLVVHDWGAALGYNYARLHPDKVKAIAFMEPALPPVLPLDCPAASEHPLCLFFADLRDPIKGYELIIEQNYFVEQILPNFVNRSLTPQEMEIYRSPYPNETSRLPTWIWPLQVPINGEPADVTETMLKIKKYMRHTKIPQLLLYASPGGIINPDAVTWYKKNLKNLETQYIGQGFHFIQEDQPDSIGRALADWLRRIKHD